MELPMSGFLWVFSLRLVLCNFNVSHLADYSAALDLVGAQREERKGKVLKRTKRRGKKNEIRPELWIIHGAKN